MPWHVYLFLFLFGSVVGSFLNVLIHRLPLGENVVFPASHCPHCGKRIRWHDNVPLLGWLWLGGRCRDCRAPISPRYPLVELAAGLLPLVVVARFGFTPAAALLTLLGMACITLLVIDLYHYILPDVITLPGIALGLALAFVPGLSPPFPPWSSALIGAAVGGGGLWLFAWTFEKVTGKPGMGFGDVKLLALFGAWMGWPALPFTLFGAAVLGSLVGGGWILFFGRDRSLPIPFGPYLIIAAWIYLFYGLRIWQWYFGLVSGGG